jgi:hypothetical protein
MNGRTIVVRSDQPCVIDLKRAAKAETNGEMRVSYHCAPAATEQYSVNFKQVPYDWSVTLEIPGGGFLPIPEGAYPYMAPTSGYQPTLRFEMPQTATNWCDRLVGAYYVQWAGGKQYGRLELELISSPNWKAAALQGLKVYLNPWASRNLEYDVNKNIGPYGVSQLEKGLPP